jgi:GntR family transcriptional regulator, transcriptional repressor for pyruvate dehydrogenase complex
MTNRTGGERMALVTLGLLAESGGPVGARRLGEVLRDNGIDVAEATAGRYLNELDEAGFTRSRGRQGRTLTAAGRERLVQLRLQGQLARASARLAASTEIARAENVVDVLHARRAIEAEAARLAAGRATCEEIDGLAEAAEDCACAEGAHQVVQARTFHRMLARAAHNRILSAVAELLLDEKDQPGDKQELHRRTVDAGAYARLAQDHRDIAEALRRRDAAAAERLTRDHLDRIIALASASPASREAEAAAC